MTKLSSKIRLKTLTSQLEVKEDDPGKKNNNMDSCKPGNIKKGY